jgi:hypothetical protein
VTALGIDIGISGAIAVMTPEGDLIDVVDMPALADGPAGRRTLNGPLLAEIVAKSGAARAYVEMVGPRPGEGAVGAFAFGRCLGLVCGVLAALSVPVTLIAPVTWKRTIGIPPGKDGTKDLARSEVIRRYP